MAGSAHCATVPFLAHPIFSTTTTTTTTERTKPLLSASIAVTSNPARRKNYLRPKILKTLTPPKTPLLPEQPLPIPVIPIESPATPSENDTNLELISAQDDVIAAEDNKVEELSVSESTPEYNGIVGKFSPKFVLKFGLFLVGAFVFQTIFYVMVLGNENPNEESRKSKSLGLGKSKGKVLNANFGSELGNVGYLDELQLDEKIEEIRAMARKARKQEKNERKGGIGGGGDDDDLDESLKSKNRIGIEKEVGDRLVTLQKRLNSNREKLRGPYVNYLGKNENAEDEDSKEGDATLMFKKGIKLKSEAKRSPKGFGGLEGIKRGSGNGDSMAGNASVSNNDGVELLDADKDENQGETDLQQSVSETSEEEPKLLQNDGKHSDKGNRKMDRGKEIKDGTVEPKTGTVQRTRRGKSSEGMKSRKSRELKKKKSPSKKEIQETAIHASSRHKDTEKEAVDDKVSGNRSKNESDPWWLDLPYVLVILMRRSSGSEVQGELYTLKLSSQPQNQSDSTYTVAFEDRGDASNFCFLLESLFEDQDEFSADIAPLPKKELREAIKSDNMKVIFVKKGQLQLYAGQPFEEVEMALRSLAEQD